MTDILVGGIKHILACGVLQPWNLGVGYQFCYALNAVLRKTIHQGKVDVELRCKAAVSEAERMVLLAFKF